jgi:hypothetical protein
MAKIDRRRPIPEYISELLPESMKGVKRWKKLDEKLEEVDLCVTRIKQKVLYPTLPMIVGFRAYGMSSLAMNFVITHELGELVHDEIVVYERLLKAIKKHNAQK